MSTELVHSSQSEESLIEGRELKVFARVYPGLAAAFVFATGVGGSALSAFISGSNDSMLSWAVISSSAAFSSLWGANFVNFSGVKKRYVTPYGWMACVPGLGRLVKPEKILSIESSHVFVKNVQDALEAQPKKATVDDFLDVNQQTLDAWTRLFKTELGVDPYRYLDADKDWAPLSSKGWHAWVIYHMHKNDWHRYTEHKPFDSMDKKLYQKKIAKAQKSGSYIPIYWEEVVQSRD